MRVAAGKTLSLDKEFDNSNERLNAIIADLNAGLIPRSRYPELLYENLFEDNTELGLGVTSKTFIAYAIKKLQDINTFLFQLKWAIGQNQFNYYMRLPNNYLQFGATLKSFSTYDLYQQDKGPYNLEPLSKTQTKVLRAATKGTIAVQKINVNTHNISSHKAADESHVTAFQMMVAGANLDVTATYAAPARNGDPSRKVIIEDRGSLDAHIAKELQEFQTKIDALVAMSDAEIFENYLRYQNIEKFKTMSYEQMLETTDKDAFAPRINGFRFQANAAQRYMNEMMTSHKITGSYDYDTNIISACGLTIEEIIATAYWASKDKINFKNTRITENGIVIEEREEVSEVVNFIFLITQLHDMRRGYDIDDDIDDVENNIYPTNHGTDHNKCEGGAINSIAKALETTHNAYNIKTVLRPDIEKKLKEIYEGIINENRGLLDSTDISELQSWRNTGRITGALANALQKEFDEKHKDAFVNEYNVYLNSREFAAVLVQGLDNIQFPEYLQGKVVCTPYQNWTDRQIYDAMKNNNIPLLHLDEKHGYESTLNYLIRIGRSNLLSSLRQFLKADNLREESVHIALWILAHSNLAIKEENFLRINGTSSYITLGDLSSLTMQELKVLFTRSIEDIVEECIEQSLVNLFTLYATKIGFTQDELSDPSGYQSQTPLLWAAKNNCHKAVTAFLTSNLPDKTNILLLSDALNKTLLHHYAANSNIELTTTILNTKDIDIVQLLGTRDYLGFTPLHWAIKIKNVEITNALIEAAGNNKHALLNIRDNNGNTPLQLAFVKGDEPTIKTLLDHGAPPSLSTLFLNNYSTEINAQLRANYLYTSTVYRVGQSVCNAVTSGLDALRIRVTINDEIQL